MSLFRTLVRVAVRHSYNSNGVCPCLEFRSTPDTAKRIGNLGLLCRNTNDGIELVYDQHRRDALELQARGEPVSFDFRVFATDPDFKSYSEPYGNPDNELLYFDNRAPGGAGESELSASGTVSDRDAITADAPEIEALLSPRDRLAPPAFVLRLCCGDQGEFLKLWLEAKAQSYTISFASRKRYWKYYLLGKMVADKSAQNRYRVVDPENRIEFEAAREETLADRRTARTFVSKQPIPLNEFYPYRFQLQQQGHNGEAVVIPSLPHASLGQTGTDTVAQQPTVVSEIYINS